jgi:hypothetical protein
LWSEKTTVCRIFSCQRIGCRSCRRCGRWSSPGRELLSKLGGARHSRQARVLRRARCHSPELSIVTSPGGDCKQNRRILLTCHQPTACSSRPRRFLLDDRSRKQNQRIQPRVFAKQGIRAPAEPQTPQAFAKPFRIQPRIWRAGAFGVPSERKRRRRLPTKIGGEYRARTGDLLVANQALSQLS